MMRIPLFTLLFPIALCLAGCGQSGDLYRPDRNTRAPQAETAPVAVTPAVDPAGQDPEQKKKEEEAAAKPAPAPVGTPPATTSTPTTPPTTP